VKLARFRETKAASFSLVSGVLIQYKYNKCHIYIEIYIKHVSKSGTGRGDQGMRKRRKER
jgi:hypothetical protein